MNKYALLIKTGDSELRALSNFPDTSSILPIIELTRGRKSKTDKEGSIEKRLKKIKDIFKDEEIILDLTSDEGLSNSTIDSFFVPDNGYSNWVNFLISIKSENCFKKLIPTIIVNGSDEDIVANLRLQASQIAKEFNCLSYRCNIEDDGCIDDIDAIKDYLNENDSFIIIDNGYIQPSELKLCSNKTVELINKILSFVPHASIIVASTSFPDKLPDEDNSTIRLSEIELYKSVVLSSKNPSIIYGDYGGVNPIRNDGIVMAHGWRPRIDVPLADSVFYYRKRRNGLEYSTTYSMVAQEVNLDSRFPSSMKNNWGIQQIINAANGASPGSNPSFWISVRMNIHIEQQLKRLKLL